MYHSVMVWTESYEVFWRVVGFVSIDVMNIYDFVESANDAKLYCLSVGFEVYIVLFSLAVCFVLVEMKDVVVTTCTETLGMNGYFSFASFAGLYFRLPF